jgi:hypothetical protein
LDFFDKDKCQKDGHKSQCKACKSKYSKSHNADSKVNERNKSLKKIYCLNNLEKEQQYRITHKVQSRKAQKDWYLRNKGLLKEKRRIYAKIRSKHDINFKLCKNLRTRLYCALKDNLKTGSAVEDLGCSIAKLKIHLQLKFTRRPKNSAQIMTWNNYEYSGWHIDHVRPLSSFDLSDPAQLKEACHYTNLQPLWSEENLRKSDSVLQ